MNKILILTMFFTYSLISKELIDDPKFKKIDKSWIFRKAPEYDYIKKADVKSGVFSVKTIQSSEVHLLSLSTAIELKAKSKYKLSFEIRGEGEGKVWFQTRRIRDPKNKKLRLVVGLNKPIGITSEWSQQILDFEVSEDLRRNDKTHLCIFYGIFLGEAQIKNISLVEVKASN
jgi:hypothetical protein